MSGIDGTDLLTKGALAPAAVVAKYGIPRTRLYEMLKSGKIEIVRLSERKILIPVAAIESYLASRLVERSEP